MKAIAVTPFWCYLKIVETITAKQLHLETKSILDQVERGEVVLVTRSGKPIVRLEPVGVDETDSWTEIMAEVWAAQRTIPKSELMNNPVLEERNRRRR
jgi:prevent-host-death family protein